MKNDVAKLMIHPVRMRILMSLSRNPACTRQLHRALPDIPVASLYRHVRRLREGGLIEVVSTRRVRGAEELTYGLVQPHLSVGRDEVAAMEPDQAIQHFATYAQLIIAAYGRFARAADTTIEEGNYWVVEASMTPAQRAALAKRLRDAFDAVQTEEADGERVGHLAAFQLFPLH